MGNEKQIVPAVRTKKKSQFRGIVRRFMKNQTAVFGLVIIVILLIFALFPAQLSNADYTIQDLANRYAGPSAEHFLGTDELGRDMYTRIVWGCRTSLTIGLTSVGIACAIGVTLGTLAGYFGGILDNVLMRIVDILMAVPNLLLGISIVAALGNSITVLVFAIALGNIAAFARVTRSSVITVRDTEYVEAARATGASDGRIMWKYVLPNALAPIGPIFVKLNKLTEPICQLISHYSYPILLDISLLHISICSHVAFFALSSSLSSKKSIIFKCHPSRNV